MVLVGRVGEGCGAAPLPLPLVSFFVVLVLLFTKVSGAETAVVSVFSPRPRPLSFSSATPKVVTLSFERSNALVQVNSGLVGACGCLKKALAVICPLRHSTGWGPVSTKTVTPFCRSVVTPSFSRTHPRTC